jgi:hypothetical protein
MKIRNHTDSEFVLCPKMGGDRFIPCIKLHEFNYICIADSMVGYYKDTLDQLGSLVTVTKETPEEMSAYVQSFPENDIVDLEEVVNKGGYDVFQPVSGRYQPTALPFNSKTGERHVYVNHVTGI